MTVSDPTGAVVHYPGEWRPIDGCPSYEVSDRGEVRSINRVETSTGRQLRGRVLATRLNNRGYVLVNVRDAYGNVLTKTMQAFVLEAFAGPPRADEEACHYNDDPADNRWPENLRWDTKPANMADRARNSPAAPKPPPKPCVRCGGKVDKGGRRCHACVTEIGEHAAPLLVAGVALDKAAEKLDYPSHTGLLVLAQKYGGLRLVLAAEPEPTPEPPPSRGVTATLRHFFARPRGG